MLRPFPSVADEEVLQDNVDMQLANQEGTTVKVINDVEEWSLDAVVKDTYCYVSPLDRPGLRTYRLWLRFEIHH